MSESKIANIKYRVFEILVKNKGKLLSAKSIAEEMGDYDVSPPQLSQFMRTYMVGEEFDEYIFMKRGGDYGLVHKANLGEEQRAFWFGRV